MLLSNKSAYETGHKFSILIMGWGPQLRIGLTSRVQLLATTSMIATSFPMAHTRSSAANVLALPATRGNPTVAT